MLGEAGETIAWADMEGMREVGGQGKLFLHQMTLPFFAELLEVMADELRTTAKPVLKPPQES